MSSLFWAVLVLVIAFCNCYPNPENTVIRSGVNWYDTNGRALHAHGGGFYTENTANGIKYYWIGTTQKMPPAWLSEGINLYSSYDLGNWTFEGLIFRNTSIRTTQPGPYRIERPKLIYNSNTRKYVVWFHLDTASFSLTSVGVLQADSVTGPYTWVAGFEPDGQPSYDMTVYKDPVSNAAYLCRSVSNDYAGISQLSYDYLTTTGIISAGPRIEGQAIWRVPTTGKYYLMGSHLTGWSANAAVLTIGNTATIQKGTTWQDLGNPSHSSTTFNSQSTFVLPYQHPNGNWLFIFMADRWDYPDVGAATYIWLPFIYNGEENISINWYDAWKISDFTSTQ